MEPTQCIEPIKLSDTDKTQLLAIAREAILHGLAQSERRRIDLASYSLALQTPAASFVTLTLAGNLRGCIGSIECYRSLIEDVAHNAYSAAFEDPRFHPLTREEYPKLKVQISVLSAKEPVFFDSECDLVRQLRVSIDGLLIEKNKRHATFLPTVWAAFPNPQRFLDQLKRKAGISDAAPGVLKAWRYTTLSFSD